MAIPTIWLDLLDYIHAHIQQPLTCALLCRQLHLSEFHFHRQFLAYFSINLADYIQRVRLHRAAHLLAYRNSMDITAIALEVGFAYPEVFSRAFKRYSGISPRKFRSAPPWDFLKQADAELSKIRTFTMSLQNPLYKVEIIQFAQLNVAILSHLGAPSGLGQSIQKFIAWRKARQLTPSRARTFNIIYTPLQINPTEAFRLDLAVEFALQSAEEGVQPGIIPGGLCACIAHQGDDTGLEAAVNYLYNQWLPAQTEYALRDAPLFFERVVFYPDVPAHLAQTHIFLPLQKPADK